MTYNLPQLSLLVQQKQTYDTLTTLLQNLNQTSNSNFTFSFPSTNSNGTSVSNTDIVNDTTIDVTTIAQMVRTYLITQIEAEQAILQADFLARGFDITVLS